MSTSTRPATWLPWGIAAICAALAVAGWLRPGDAPDDGAAAETADAPRPTAPPDADPPRSQLAALTECTTRLERLRTVVDLEATSRASTDEWLAASDGGVPALVGECLARPGVLAIATRVAGERRAEQRSEELGAVRRTLSELLGIPLEDVDWMSDYVCASRALRRDALAELRDATEPADVLLEPLRVGRVAILGDVRNRIGEERYAAFREIGGVGMLGEVLECDP